jgi:hypothetical protein
VSLSTGLIATGEVGNVAVEECPGSRALLRVLERWFWWELSLTIDQLQSQRPVQPKETLVGSEVPVNETLIVVDRCPRPGAISPPSLNSMRGSLKR